MAVVVDGGEGFAPALESGGFEADEDVKGGELAEGGVACGFGYGGVGFAGFEGYVGGVGGGKAWWAEAVGGDAVGAEGGVGVVCGGVGGFAGEEEGGEVGVDWWFRRGWWWWWWSVGG